MGKLEFQEHGGRTPAQRSWLSYYLNRKSRCKWSLSSPVFFLLGIQILHRKRRRIALKHNSITGTYDSARHRWGGGTKVLALMYTVQLPSLASSYDVKCDASG